MARKSDYSQKKNEYTQQYIRDHYKQLSIRLPVEGAITRDTIANAAQQAGSSVNAYIIDAVKEKMERSAKDRG